MINYIKTHKKQVLWIAIVTILALAILFTAMYFTGVFDDRTKALVETITPTFTAERTFGGNTIWTATIVGEIKNRIHTTVDYIGFRFHLLDKDGNIILDKDGKACVAEGFILDLAGGETRKYTASVILSQQPFGFVVAEKEIKQ